MQIRGVLLDLDGTVFVGNSPLPGAAEALGVLSARGVPYLFVTNMTRRPRRVLIEKLASMDLPVAAEQIYTAPLAAGLCLRRRGVHRVLSCLVPATLEDLPGFDFVTPGGPEEPLQFDGVEAVLVGDLGDGWSYALLNQAFRCLMAGAELIAVQRNLYWQGQDGLCLDAGPFVTALEVAARVEATVVGKPSPEFFAGAAETLGLPLAEIAVVGDDILSDVGGAQRAGARGVLVRTGKYRERDLEGPVVPDVSLDSIARLPDWLADVDR